MDRQTTNPFLRWVSAALAGSLAVIMGWMAVRHGVAEYWANSGNPERWQQAAVWEPDNPRNWHQIGRYYQVDLERSDISRAIANFSRAASMAPGSAENWIDLAEAQETAQQTAEAEKDFRNAERAYPLSAEVAWRFGNFLLRQQRQDEAYRQIYRALTVQPGLTALAFSRCWQSSRDINRILQLALPAKLDAYWGAIDFLTEAREPDAAMVVWKRLTALNDRFELRKSFPLEEMLIETGHAQDVRTVWQQSLTAAEVPGSASRVWNGGFEQELTNGGLGWRFRAVPGAELSLDRSVLHSETRSLRVDFDGKENVDFKQPWQYVVLDANTRYRISAYFRTNSLSTSSGVHLELQENHFGGPVQSTADLSENQGWLHSEMEYSTGHETAIYRLVLRRPASQKLDNKISGTVWMDDISITPITEGSGPQ
jgi:tetratricopeptide (TPR) repeat protein